MTTKKKAPPKPKKTGRRKKGRLYIPADKMLALCAVIVAACTVLLAVNTLLESGARKAAVPVEKHAPETDSPRQGSSGRKEKSAPAAGKQAEKDGNRRSAGQPQNAQEEKQSPRNKTAAAPSGAAKNSADGSAQSAAAAAPARNPEPRPDAAKNAAPQSGGQGQAAEKPAPAARLSDIPDIPAAQGRAKLAFVFDDAGHNLNQLEKFVSLPFPVTIAVLPQLPHSKECAARVRAAGKEVILHQPMQAVNLNVNPGPGAVTPEMTGGQIAAVIRENVAEIGPVRGINNHEGSLICEDEMRIGSVLQTVSDLGIYFLDSRTTSQSRVPQAAMSLGLSYYERNVFLDNTKNRADILAEIVKGVGIANRTGAVILIGHVWSADILPGILLELYPILAEKGYTLTSVSDSGAKIAP